MKDELVYFDINAGARQAEGIRADLSYDTNVKFENQAGSTKVVSQVDGTGGEADMRFGVRFKNPYIKDIAEYDYLEIPIYNANDYDIQMKCWWSNHVLLKKGEWTKVILSASVVSGGYFNDLDYSSAAPWNSGKFFIAFIDGDGGAIQTDCTVYLGAMMGKSSLWRITLSTLRRVPLFSKRAHITRENKGFMCRTERRKRRRRA